MLAGCQRHDVLLLEPGIVGMCGGRQRFFQPGDVVRGHLAGHLLDGGGAVGTVAHAPPAVGIHHEVEIGPGRLAHQPDSFHVLLGPERGTHLVSPKAKLRDGRGFGGETFGRHVHSRAAVKLDAIAHTAAKQLGHRHTERFAG